MTTMDFFNSGMHNGFVVTDDLRSSMIINEGAEDKFFIEYEDKFLVKDSSFNKRRKQQSLAPFCEYVGSNFILASGLLSCQKCYLGQYENRPVVICQNAFPGGEFRPFRDLHESSAGTDLSTKEYTYSDVLYVLEVKEKLEGIERDEYLRSFWRMFLFDAILGNRDRHEGNWGFYRVNQKSRFSPVIDNGSCLFPDVDLSKPWSRDFIFERTYRMPASQFRMWKPEYVDRAMRTNFWEVLNSYSEELKDQLDIISKLDYKNLIEVACSDVPLHVAAWFRVVIESRFRCLILKEDFEQVYADIEEEFHDYC